MTQLSIVVPAKNEEANLPELLLRIDKTLAKNDITYEVIVVDDYSTDKTSEVVLALSKKYPVTLLKKKGRPGKAFAVLEGARRAKSFYVAMIDADLQYPPEILPEMLKVAKEKGVAVGNRTKRHTSKLRAVASKSFRFLFGKVLMGMDTDVQSGIKVFRREIVEHLDEQDVTPWTLDMPLLHTARELGYSIGNVNMEFLERKNGNSKVGVLKTSTEIGAKAIKMRFSRRRIYTIKPDGVGMIGAGVIHKKSRYVTHTTLPHKNSAIVTVTGPQKLFILMLASLLAIGLILTPFNTVLLFVAVLSVIYFLDVLFGAFVLLKSLHFPPEIVPSALEIAKLTDRELPIYTILCPLYKESRILPHFVEAMNLIDWPKEKLEVLLLLEENDPETIKVAKHMDLPSNFKIVVVPHSFPKTKPKACNYGLSIATGEYVVIYDAEDKPDPLQLKKVYLAFKSLGRKYGCIQCKLNYFNPSHNLLTRLFTAEYSLWFDVILPGLQSIESMIPLGGTSNHFRREDLITLNAWDPFNVTEDADLGMRLFKEGYRTAIVDSTTLEEANSKVGNWIRQRSRWIKGYFQTYLVHMREPVKFFRQNGVHALLFQLIVGMRMSFMLINPILWVVTVLYFTLNSIVGPTIEALFPPLVFYMAVFALVIGNFMYIYNYMIGAAKKGHWDLVKFVFLIPFYWLLTSIAAFMALWQLITKPHYWEKTTHGLHLGPEKKEIKKSVQSVLVPQPMLVEASVVRERFWKKYLTVANVSAGLLIASALINNFFGFLYNAYLGRVLKPEEFGVIGLLGSFLYISQVLTSGLGKTVTYKSAKLLGKHKKTVKLFWEKTRARWMVVSLSLTLLWALLTPVLMRLFNSNDPIPFILFSPLWITGLLGAVDAGFLSGNLRFSFMAMVSILESVLKFLLVFLFVNLRVTELVYTAIPLSALVSFLVSWGYILRTKAHPITKETKEDLAFPRKFFATSILTKISSVAFLSFDVLLAKLFLSPYEAGLYTLLSLVGKMIYFLGSLFAQFITPMVSKAEGEGKSSHRVFWKLMMATTFSSFVGFLGLGVFGHISVPLLFGSKTTPILGFLLPYTLAMVATTIAISVVNYHQIKNQHLFPVVSFAISALEVLFIWQFHSDLSSIVWMMIGVGFAHLAIIALLHLFYSKIKVIGKNLLDLFGLFRPIPQGRKNGGLRILVFNWRDTKHIHAGGAEIYMHEIAKRWVLDGNKVTVFCGNDNKNPRHEKIDGVRIVRRGGFYTVYIWAALYYVLRFRGRYDVVIDNENGIPFFTPIYVRVPKFLLIHHIHEGILLKELHLRKRLLPVAFITKYLESKVMPFVYRNSTIVTVSESSKKDIEKLNCKGCSEISIVNPGVDLSFFRKSTKSASPTFVYLGRLKAYKNIDVAIKAFAKVSKRHVGARFLIVGEGTEIFKLKQLAEDLGLGGKVVFTGKVDEEEKVRLLGKAWASIQPSSFEGWGITVIEANAAGTPVIASKTNGLKDSVVDGQTGLLIPVKNIEMLAKAMIEIVENDEFRNALSRNAYLWAQRFSWDESAQKFYSLIDKEINKVDITGELAKETI